MKKSTLLLSAFSVAVLAAGGAHAQQNSATTSASVGATIVPAIAISKTVDLNFGDVVAGSSSGTVELSTAGSRLATGGTTLANTASTAAASFNVTGDPNGTYAITLPSSVDINSGGDTMTVDNFVSNPSGTGLFSGGGSQTLLVGATLNVGANQPTGIYSGSFDVTVAYN
jgi:hypothetical protein